MCGNAAVDRQAHAEYWRAGPGFLSELVRIGREPDQRIVAAAREVGYRGLVANDANLFYALCKHNCCLTRVMGDSILERCGYMLTPGAVIVPDPACSWGHQFKEIVERAIEHSPTGIFGSGAFLLSLLDVCLERGDALRDRPATVDMLLTAYGTGGYLSRCHDARMLIERMRSDIASRALVDDFGYMLVIGSDGRFRFRVASVLGDFAQVQQGGTLVPHRAMLTHFGQEFGFYAPEEIEELEELIGNPKAREADFQRFFDRHPHFLRRCDYREVFTQVHLCRPEGDLIPDFILTNRDLQRAAIVELKLPAARLVRHQDNRTRFSAAVMEARSQLLTYREWFRQKENREMLKQMVGMEVYEPALSVVIGRASEFQCDYDRQSLASQNPDIEVMTYDDILRFAQRRRMNIERAEVQFALGGTGRCQVRMPLR
jgi:hypothetical protein